jgi:predicted nuclease of predicted toxin-antitoxin system
MRLLLDECLPRRAKFLFAEAGHECETVRDAGFSGKENGELIRLAEKKFEVLITIRTSGISKTSLAEMSLF